MGTGDWDDGMNQVGVGSLGESVWNGWFMLATSSASTTNEGPFTPAEELRKDLATFQRYADHNQSVPLLENSRAVSARAIGCIELSRNDWLADANPSETLSWIFRSSIR